MKQNESLSPRSHRNGSFRTSFGFVLACVGSAVGMGNIWMFPYRLGEYGGAVGAAASCIEKHFLRA